MNYVVIDLEMCKVPKMYRNKMYKYATEIIEIGTVLLNEDFRQIATLRQYVHPEYGVLDHYISNLTGIQNVQIKNAPLLEESPETSDEIGLETGSIKFLRGVSVTLLN